MYSINNGDRVSFILKAIERETASRFNWIGSADNPRISLVGWYSEDGTNYRLSFSLYRGECYVRQLIAFIPRGDISIDQGIRAMEEIAEDIKNFGNGECTGYFRHDHSNLHPAIVGF